MSSFASRQLRTSKADSGPAGILFSLYARAARHWQNTQTAFAQVWANKGRSLLTTLGIIIAVTSTITVVSFVKGFGNYVTDMIRGFGTNAVFIIPYIPPGPGGLMLGRVVMDPNDTRAVGTRCDKVRRISPIIFGRGDIEYARNKVTGMRIRGATEDFQTIRRFFIEKGRFFSPLEVDNAAYVCVIGQDLLKQLECDERIVGDFLFINGLRFRVLGLLEGKGNFMDDNQDQLIVIPYTTALKMWPEMRLFVPFMMEASSEHDVDEACLQATSVLRERHKLEPGEPNDFRVLRQDEFLREFQRVEMIATSVLAGIVGISLIVGGIGVMNVMLVSVTERTREIGLRKSVGGRRRDILAQFLTEAVVLATLGGAIGIFLGYSICAVATLHPSMVKVVVPAWVVLLALSFSAGVGILFGLIPALKAAIIHPIDALRHG